MTALVLRRHALRHIRELKVDPEVLATRFDRGCDTSKCSGQCCATGVWADAFERDAILRHADAILLHMDGSQQRDPAQWFDPVPWDHADFPSGRGIGTAVAHGSCVFLRTDRRCVLQQASNADTGPLKPFFCYAFPLTIGEGALCLDEPQDRACCAPSTTGPATVLDVCAEELQYMLGPDGVDELRERVGSVDS